MSTKLGCVAGVGVAMLAFSAFWVGCSSSSTNDPAATDAGGATPTEGGSTPDSGTPDSSTPAQDASPTDAAIGGPFVDMQFGNCPAFVACGGDPTGLWTVTGGCVDETIFAAAKAQCAGLTASNVTFKARGTITADATKIQRATEVKYTATFAIPPECKNANPLGTKCSDLETALTLGAGLQSATCKDAPAGGGCDCDVADTTPVSSSDTYTKSGNVLTTGSGSGARTYDYCVTGNDIAYKETTAKTALPASFTLTK